MQHAVGKSIAALANTDGGWLIIGQADDGTRLGLESDFLKSRPQNSDGFLQKFKHYVSANLEPSWEAIGLELEWVETAAGQVLVVKVPRSSRPVWVRNPANRANWQLFVRRATITEALEGPALVEWSGMRR